MNVRFSWDSRKAARNHRIHDGVTFEEAATVFRDPTAYIFDKETMNTQEDKLESADADELNAHCDFDYSQAKPNRFAARLAQEQMMVVLDPDIAAIFPTSEAVNEALRVLATAAQNLPDIQPNRSSEQHQSAALPIGQE